MYIVATFIGDDSFTHLIDTNKLNAKLKEEMENRIKNDCLGEYEIVDLGTNYEEFQKGIIIDKSMFPVQINGIVSVYLF